MTLPEKRLANRRQLSDRRAAPQQGAIDPSRLADLPSTTTTGALCPKCGSPRIAPTAQVEADSRQLNLFKCETCHSRFVTSTES